MSTKTSGSCLGLCVVWALCVVGTVGFGQMFWATASKSVNYYRAAQGTFGEPGTVEPGRDTGDGMDGFLGRRCRGSFTPEDGAAPLRVSVPGGCTIDEVKEARLVSGDTSGRITNRDPDAAIMSGSGAWFQWALYSLVIGIVTLLCAMVALGPVAWLVEWRSRRRRPKVSLVKPEPKVPPEKLSLTKD
ncbi:hypothetical protein [Streptomyces alkaliterrae]|uniref:Uncharacterized protein n=1 Tax=Streptomyces alkaliterrae TaxID=2213162 RepID=A0A5P0YZ16_9ACTN|nr:hypothetical protein [Streptomyces alkaliterrae]MBB1257056.1 hypothetical protein [Streptomyces alkaliterrae]MBB1260500.1 hypothetical protein [Streptomyces alkaliterrae]MQS05536.1 hypothetical protein [Streptomyces alkaliterrae]